MAKDNEQPAVMYVSDIAKKLGKSKAAIRAGVRRQVAWLPTPFRMGEQLAWLVADVESFIAAKSQTKPAIPADNNEEVQQ